MPTAAGRSCWSPTDPVLLLAAAHRCLLIDDDVRAIPPARAAAEIAGRWPMTTEATRAILFLQSGPLHPAGLAGFFPRPDPVPGCFVDVYTAVLALGTIGALAAGLVLALREQVAQAWGTNAAGRTLVAPPSFSLPDGAAAAVLVFAALVTVMTVARSSVRPRPADPKGISG